MNLALLTLGTRGDVEPFVALALELQGRGHHVTLAAGHAFGPFVEAFEIPFAGLDDTYLHLNATDEGRRLIGGKVGQLPRLLRDMVRPSVARSLRDAQRAVQGADALVFHPKVLAGPHLAELLNVPGFVVGTVPVITATRAFPVPALLPPRARLGPVLNAFSYRLTDAASAPFRKLIAAWRAELGLPRRFAPNLRRAGSRELPVLYAFSAHVVPRPNDWDAETHLTGFWQLPPSKEPLAPELARFLDGGSGQPTVFVGFGSMTSGDARQLGRVVREALKRVGARGVVARNLASDLTGSEAERVFAVDNLPHGALFPRVNALVYHGGASTTGAGLTAGKPSVICPFGIDQPFWGERVRALGVGPAPIPQRHLDAERLAKALRAALQPASRAKAQALGILLHAENGAARAANLIEGARRKP